MMSFCIVSFVDIHLDQTSQVETNKKEKKKDNTGTSHRLRPPLPVLHPPVPQDDQADQQANQGAGEVRLVAGVAVRGEEGGEDVHGEDAADHEQAADPHHQAISWCCRLFVPQPLPGVGFDVLKNQLE